MSPPNCDHETDALKYFSGQLSGNELAMVEAHIAGCSKCCQALAELAKIMTAEVSEEEKAFLSATLEESAKEARELVKKALKESEALNASHVASLTAHHAKQNKNSKGFFLFNSKANQLAIAASIVILLLVGAMVFYKSNSPLEDPQIAQVRGLIKEINLTGRPTRLRIAGFDYAPENKTRGSESEEPARKLKISQDILESIVKKAPTPSNHQHLAQILLFQSDYDGATTQLSEAVKIDSTNPSILNDLAVVQAAQNDYEVALQTINKVLHINPNYLAAIFNRALIYIQLKQYNKARSDWEKYLQLDPNSPWATEAKQQLNSIKQ